MKRTFLFTIGLLLTISARPEMTGLSQTTYQTAKQKTNDRSADSITGRVVNETGRPMPNVKVFVVGMGRQGVRQTVLTDEGGKYIARALPRGSYGVSAQANGYVHVRELGDPFHYRPGETANFTLKKGAAITGVVTNSEGEPVVAVPISVTLVRDIRGLAIGGAPGRAVYTDDRGVYRLFGLSAGTYIVAAGLRTAGSQPTGPYVDDTPTYYPSSTRDTAVEVSVQFGAEATGIDIRYRGEPGYAVSGTIANASSMDSVVTGTTVLLVRTSNDTPEAQTVVQQGGTGRSFAFYGVPDGDYHLIARRFPNQSDDGAASKRISVKVRGQDVTGLAISLVPNGSIAGRLTLDMETKSLRCETTRAPAIEETLITVQNDETDKSDPSTRFASPVNAPDNNGEFLIRGLPPGRYLLDNRRFLDDAWYVLGATVPGATDIRVNANHSGMNVRPRQRIDGIRIVIGEGAASLTGRVVAEPKGTSLPDRLRVHLLPAEPSSANDILRFSDAEVLSDGSFKLKNLAPGRYLLVPRARTEEEAKQRSPRPLSWNATARAELHRLARAANTTVELKPCQRVADYKLQYSAQNEARQKRP